MTASPSTPAPPEPSLDNLRLVRLLLAGGVVVVMVVLGIIVVIALLHGVAITAPSLGGLVAFIGLLLTVLTNLIGTRATLASVQVMVGKLNGHIAHHEQATAVQVDAQVDARLRQLGITIVKPPDKS